MYIMNKQIIFKKNSITSFFSLVFNTFGAKKNHIIHLFISEFSRGRELPHTLKTYDLFLK